jgi:hypothetical protein
MTPQERELNVYRIVSGCIKCRIHDTKGKEITLLLKSPNRYQKYLAEEVYRQTLEESQLAGMQSETEVIHMMIEQGLWDEDRQRKLDTLPKDLEELKVKMFELTFKSDEKRITRNLCNRVKADIADLQIQRAAYSYLSAEGAAHLAKVQYIIGMSLFYLDGNPFFTEDTYWTASAHVIEEAIEFYNQCRLSETKYRDLVRNEPWRTIWSARKIDGLFNIPAVDLTEEQKALVVWSNIYDSIYMHQECPSDDIIEDDDILDGWMIVQRRKRKQDSEKNKADELVKNENVKKSGEIYIPANTIEDAKNVDDLNDNAAKMTKLQRFAFLNKKGQAHEIEMPDTKLDLQQQINRKFVEQVKNG